jgi:hypothetical protein
MATQQKNRPFPNPKNIGGGNLKNAKDGFFWRGALRALIAFSSIFPQNRF